ncbi:MAG: nucleotide exchange factor GrpE [Clostridia bacterium]|nr:nucleotide exchange factor GrpE [Clostridia bacterium]
MEEEKKEEMIPEEEPNEKKEEDNGAEHEKKAPKKNEESKKLRSKLDAAEKKIKELEGAAAENDDRYKRVLAEYDNFRKRSQKEKETVYSDGVSDAVMGLVPVFDNLMYAEKYTGADPDKFAEGVKLIIDSFPAALEKMGVTAFGEPGDTFDPEIHNAVMHVEDDALGEGEIVEILQKGYKYRDRVIRHAMVKVAN